MFQTIIQKVCQTYLSKQQFDIQNISRKVPSLYWMFKICLMDVFIDILEISKVVNMFNFQAVRYIATKGTSDVQLLYLKKSLQIG